MKDDFPSLPPYPIKPEQELPSPRKWWQTALWVAFALLFVLGVVAFTCWLISGLWVLGPGLGVGLLGIAIIVIPAFMFVWKWFERFKA